MATKTRDTGYSAEKRNNISEINIFLYTYFFSANGTLDLCVLKMISDFFKLLT